MLGKGVNSLRNSDREIFMVHMSGIRLGYRFEHSKINIRLAMVLESKLMREDQGRGDLRRGVDPPVREETRRCFATVKMEDELYKRHSQYQESIVRYDKP